MADVFVSHTLESQGCSRWWDPKIAPDQEFDRLIAEAEARLVASG